MKNTIVRYFNKMADNAQIHFEDVLIPEKTKQPKTENTCQFRVCAMLNIFMEAGLNKDKFLEIMKTKTAQGIVKNIHNWWHKLNKLKYLKD